MKRSILNSAYILIFILLFSLPPSLFCQNNSGFFAPYTSRERRDYFIAVASGDVNADGRDDIVATSTYPTEKLVVITQDSNGDLNSAVSYTLPIDYDSGAIAIADVNSDSLKDVILAGSEGISVYYQTATGTLSAPTLFSAGTSTAEYPELAVGDIGNDGDMDVIYTRGATVRVFTQAGGTLTVSTIPNALHGNIGDVDFGDLNQDGRGDIALMTHRGNPNEIAIFYQQADGSFSATTTFLNGSIYSGEPIKIGDIDGDTFNDIYHIPGDAIGYFQDDLGNMGTATVLNAYDFQFADLSARPGGIIDAGNNGLNDPYIVTSSLLGLLVQQPDHSFVLERYSLSASDSPHNDNSTCTGDVNHDGRQDIITELPRCGIVILYGWDGSRVITVQRPYFEEVLTMGSNTIIRWGTSGLPPAENVDIFYSVDNGTNWSTVSTDETNDGAFTWTVPYRPSTTCFVRVQSHGGGSPVDNSDIFTIEDDGVDRIIVTYPNGGESLEATSTANILWDTTGSVGNVKIDYSTNNGSTWTNIVAVAPNGGIYPWVVPSVTSNQCLIRISDAVDSSPTDTSNAIFSIVPFGTQTLTLTSPNGGEALVGGANHFITWQSSGTINSIQLEYSLNNGTSWNVITDSALNTGTYTWNVPNIGSNQCLVRISDAADGNPADQSNATFVITTSGSTTATLTVTTPNGGEDLWSGFPYDITWTSTGGIGTVRIQYSINNGGSWSEVIASTPNTGIYSWAVPSVTSDLCLIRISDATDGTPADNSNAVFSIMKPQPIIYITSPKNGDYLQIGKKHNITWRTRGTIGNVKIEYATDNQVTWKTVVAATTNDGSYSWTVPNAPSTNCNIRIKEAADGKPSATTFGRFNIVKNLPGPEISLSRTNLYFASVLSTSARTPAQTILINNNGYGVLKWQIDTTTGGINDNGNWLSLSNTAGTESGAIEVRVNPVDKPAGTYTAILTFTATNAVNSPQTAIVTLYVYPYHSDTPPFGTFETPLTQSTVQSSIPVTGWVLDDIGIDKVTIWRNGTAAEGGGQVYIGDAILVDGARPDVEASYPTYPLNYQAGWGYMMLTNGLPDGGNSAYVIYAYARDVGGNEVLLGQSTIYCDNANAAKPFGAIDTPEQGGTAYGSKYRNQGWALTPQPNKIPENGSTLTCYIDGQSIGHLTYNIYRSDIANIFAGYTNSNGALAYIDFDTTPYQNGVHTIQWSATDNAGNTDGIGSRFFTINNTGYTHSLARLNNHPLSSKNPPLPFHPRMVRRIPLEYTTPLLSSTNYNTPSSPLKPDANGTFHLTVSQDQRLEITPEPSSHSLILTAYLDVNHQLRPLPIGASIDSTNGILYWQVGPGFFGQYSFVLITMDPSGKLSRKHLTIHVTPKFHPHD